MTAPPPVLSLPRRAPHPCVHVMCLTGFLLTPGSMFDNHVSATVVQMLTTAAIAAAGAADDQTLDLQQAMTAAAAAAATDAAAGAGGSTISPSLLTLDAGTAFEKGVFLGSR